MKIGLLAFSTQTGLGYQTRNFAKFMNPDKILIADISKLNKMPVDHSWAPDARITDGLPTNEDCEWLVNEMDVIFLCETPLNYHLLEYANQRKVATVLQYNYEFLNYFRDSKLPAPTLLAAPSPWFVDKVKELEIAPVVSLPVPVDLSTINYRPMYKVDTFVHIIGRPAMHDRNGTLQYLEALEYLVGPYSHKIYLQTPKEENTKIIFEPVEKKLLEAKQILGDKLEIIRDIDDNTEMYKSGEILVLPRKYGGLCLPMQEALCAGMPVLMPKISPNDDVLPSQWLFDAEKDGHFMTHSPIPMYKSVPSDIAMTMELTASSIAKNNNLAMQIAIGNSWQNPFMANRYLNAFEEAIDLCA